MFKLGGRGYLNLEAMKMQNMLKYIKHYEDYAPSNAPYSYRFVSKHKDELIGR